jgi:hypothetical protein
MEERQKNIQLEQELNGYKTELHESYKTIVEMRYLIKEVYAAPY